MTIAALNQPPSSEDVAAEADVLSRMLYAGVCDQRGVSEEAAAIVAAADFVKGANGDVFTACQTVAASGRVPGPMTVHDELERVGRLEAAGGAGRLFQLVELTATCADLAVVCRSLADRSRRRRVAAAAAETAVRALDRSLDVGAEVSRGVDRILTAGHVGAESGTVAGDDLVGRMLGAGNTGDRGASTGWRDVDRLYRIVPGLLSLLYGLPAAGKSALLDHLLVHRAKADGDRFALWSPESAPIEHHAVRLAELWSGHRWATLGQPEREAFALHVSEHFTWVDHDVHDTLDGVLAQVRATHDRERLAGFVLDPWTEFDFTGAQRGGLREDQVFSREITKVRRFARAHDLHTWIVVHPNQLKANLADGTYPVPTLGDLTGGAVWRKKADFAVCVWRDELGRVRPPELVDVHVQKVRFDTDGRVGQAQLRMDTASRRFMSVARHLEAV